MMSGFRRSHSKVWWANYYPQHDRGSADDEASGSSLSPPFPQFNRRRRRSTDETSQSDRTSSSSPSNGSQKSQDSGFSDSDSSTPSSGSAKGDSGESGGDIRSTSSDSNHQSSSSTSSSSSANAPAEITAATTPTFPRESSSSRLPGTPVNRIPRLVVITPKPNESTSSEELRKLEQEQTNKLVSTYLAECYFPITTLIEGKRSSHASQLPSVRSCPSSSSSDSEEESSVSLRQSPSREHKRTCFIVGETPKKQMPTSVKNESPSSSHDGTADDSTMEGSYSLSYDDTVREITPEDERVQEVETVPSLTQPQPQNPRVDATYKMSSSNDISVVSCTDANYLMPEPTFTSTPKKDLQISRRLNKKLRDAPVLKEPEAKQPEIVERHETADPPVSRLVDPPVVRWLFELQYHYETECMTALQAKRIPQYYKKKTSDILMVSESSSSLQTFEQRTKTIANEFLNLYESIKLRTYEYVNSQLGKLIATIKEFIINYSQLLPRMESVEKENVLKIMDLCDRFQKLFIPFDQQATLNDLHMLEKLFSQFVDSVLLQQMMLLVSELDHPNSETTLLTALNSIVTLNLSTPRTLNLVTRLDGIQKLLTISLKSSSSTVRKTALRSLTIVCQNASSIRQLERARGVAMISEMLCDEGRGEVELTEVISVLVQITAPWIEDDHIIKGLIYHLYPIINALTRLITATSSSETLLLCAAALANISFIEPQAVFIVAKLGTLSCLLTAVRKLGVRASIFLQEQVATLIANMAAEAEIRPHLAQHRAIGALLCFLQVKHFPLQTEAEIAAAERLQHKSAVALSRLCSSPEIAKQVVELQGVSRLVRLCREERERNYSDGVLVACLTSLRKITANCGSESIVDLNAKELVEPRLVDSFLMYSSKQESYV